MGAGTELTIDDPCILFAVGQEARAFCSEFRPQQRFPGAPCKARFCGPEWLSVLVLETGIGPEQATRALSWLFSRPCLEQVPYRPKVVLTAGFAGALQDDLRVGDVILATEVLDHNGGHWPTTWPGDLPAGEWRPLLRRGGIFSSPRIIATAEEKRSLGQTHGALAVDMESATVAAWCSRQGIPFGSVRAISDDVHTPLSPRLLSLISRGSISPLRLVRALVASPRLAGELWRLERATHGAAIQLQQALGELLTLTLPWGKDL